MFFRKFPSYTIDGADGYCDRIATGLKQLMAGARKFALEYLSRDDLVSLTEECTKVTGIPYVMDSDQEEVDKIFG